MPRRPPRTADALRADIAEGLTVAAIAGRRGVTVDHVYGQLRRHGIAVNPRPRRDWTGLADQLELMHPGEVARLRGCSIATIYRAAKLNGIPIRKGR